MYDYEDTAYSELFGPITLKETNVRNYNTGLFYKFVMVLDERGRDVSEEFAQHYGYRTTKRLGFKGQLMSGGYGFRFIDSIKSSLRMIQGRDC